MAWISVHEDVNGPKLRRLAKQLECSLAEALGILNFLWLWGLRNADENGKVLYAERVDIETAVLPVTGIPPEKVADALFSIGWIDEDEGCIYLHDWDVWQEQWYKYLRTKAYNAERKRIERRREKESKVPTAAPPPEEPKIPETYLPEPGSGDPAAKPPEARYTPEFEAWWEVYPRKTDKGYAYKKYIARRKDGYSDAELMIAAKNYASQCKKFRTERQFIKHPKTFLSDALPFLEYITKNPVTVAATVTSGNPYAEWGEQNE